MTRPPKIAVVTTSYPEDADDPSGHFVRAEARALVDAGARVVVLAPSRRPRRSPGNPEVLWLDGGDTFGWPGVIARLRERPWRVVGMLRFIRNARRALRDRGPFDEIVSHWLLPSGWPISWGQRGATETVAHGSDVRLVAALPRPVARRLLALLTRDDRRIRFVADELVETLRARDVLPSDADISVDPCAVEIEGVPQRVEARSRLGVPLDRRLVLVVGRLVENKRVDEALVTATRDPKALVVVVGDGPKLPGLIRKFPEVRFVGRTPRSLCLEWMSAADLLVSASRQEGAPTSIREARALGLPVLAAPAGAVARWATTDPGIELMTD